MKISLNNQLDTNQYKPIMNRSQIIKLPVKLNKKYNENSIL